MPHELTALLSTHLCELGFGPPEPIPLRPVRRDRPGDFSTAVARTVTGRRQGADQLAQDLADRLRGASGLAQVHAEAGYLTLTLTTGALAGGVHRLLDGARAAPVGVRPGEGEWPGDLLPVAFAHARCRNVARAARAHDVRPARGEELDTTVGAVVGLEHTRALLVRLAADSPGGRGGVVLLRDLATTYQDFYSRTRTAPRGVEPVTSRHRTHLALTEATAAALAAGLASLGLHAPEHL